MGRPSKLTDAQWAEVERRLLSGETSRKLGPLFGVAESAIRKRFGAHQKISAQSAQVRTVAEKLVVAQVALEALPVSQRPVAVDLADKLRGVSGNIATAAQLSSATAVRLAAIANGQVQYVDDVSPFSPESTERLKGISALTKLSNDASMIGLNLLAANKDSLKQLDGNASISAPVVNLTLNS